MRFIAGNRHPFTSVRKIRQRKGIGVGADDGALPATVVDAVERARISRAELADLIASLSEEQLTAPGPEEWAIKDHLAHLEVWSRALQDLLDGQPRSPRFLVSSPEEMRSIHIDVINDRIFQKNRDRSLEGVLAGFRESHQATIDRLRNLSDADLARPYRSYAHPDEDHPDGHEPIVGWIAGNTWEHDAEHRGWIRDHFRV